MHIYAEIKSFKTYAAKFELPQLSLYQFGTDDLEHILRNNSFLLQLNTSVYGVSVWTGPKRTRTYPYQHVYDTIHHNPRLTLIPYVKDEGRGGDRDFLQWDTISLMTLLGVYVIVTYHQSAERSFRKGAQDKEKITNHRVDVDYVAKRITELSKYSSDVLHWNNKEIDNLPHVIQQTILHHPNIETQTGVTLHAVKKIQQRLDKFLNYRIESRRTAKSAQARELSVIHSKESLVLGKKAAITITNFYNGEYNFTVDEGAILDDKLFLIEKKHANNAIMPDKGDIKDGLLKIRLYCQLEIATLETKNYTPFAVLGLTGNGISGYCHSVMDNAGVDLFFEQNSEISESLQNRLKSLFDEARQNSFFAYFANAANEKVFLVSILDAFSNSI